MRKTTRIANWPEVCSVALTTRCIAPRGIRNASQIARPATRANSSEHDASRCRGCAPPRKIEIAMSGPNSPTAPIAPTACPNGVRSSPASRRIGRSVPRAVEHSAMPMTIAISPGAMSQATPDPDAEADEPAEDGRAAGAAAERRELDLRAGDEEQHREAELRQRRRRSRRAPPSRAATGPTTMPSTQLEHDDRDADPAAEAPGEQRSQHGEQRDDQQRRLELVHAFTVASRTPAYRRARRVRSARASARCAAVTACRALSASRSAPRARAAASVSLLVEPLGLALGLLGVGLEPRQLGAQVVDALAQVVGPLAGLRELGVDLRRARAPPHRRRVRPRAAAFSAALRARRSARSSRRRRGRIGHAGQAPADRVRDVDRVEPGRLERAHEPRRS